MRQRIPLVAFLLLCCGLCGNAAIRYTPQSLSIDSKITTPGINFNIGLPGGLFMKGSNTDRFFKISIPDYSAYGLASPCIDGGTISFYYEAYKHKQWIYCREVFTMSDERSKTDISDMPPMLANITQKTSESIAKSKSIFSSGAAKTVNNEYDLLKGIIPGGIDIIEGDTLINNDELIAVLVKATQELYKEVEQQQSDLQELKDLLTQAKSKTTTLGQIVACSPNPADDRIIVSYILPETATQGELSFSDNSGNIVRRTSVRSGEEQIELSVGGYANGIYYIVLTDNGKVIDTFRIIKK